MNKLFFFIFPLAFAIGFMPFFFNQNEQTSSVSAGDYSFDKNQNQFIELCSFIDIEDSAIYQPHFIERQEPEKAELLQIFPFGYIDNATFILPEGISFI